MTDHHHKVITVCVSTVMAVGALVGIWAYIEGRRVKKLQGDVLALDKEIKELELSIKQHQYSSLS